MAVVDSECRVLGVDGLRVCDASIFPELPAYNTSRPSYLVGEVLGDLLTSETEAGGSRGRRRPEQEPTTSASAR
jgi:choline dehydrogenase-like flavoprotein